MDDKELKTSTKTRIFIGIIAVVMLGSIIAGYAAIIYSNSHTDDGLQIDTTQLAAYQEAYETALSELQDKTKEVSQNDYNTFVPYRSEVSTYDENSANSDGLQTKDLLEGSGKELTAGDTDYLAYYLGWCADGSVFDSSFDDNTNPTSFANPIDPSQGLVTGWNDGVVGMKIGGIRELTIPGDQAYGETREICGGTNKPLKFIVMAVANEEPLKTLVANASSALQNYQFYAYTGMSYDELMQQNSEYVG